MRRPTPLPPTAESSTDAAERASSPGPDPSAPVDEAEREDLASPAEVDAVSIDEGSVAPVIPLTSPTTMQRPAELPSTAGPEAGDDGDGDG